MKNNTIYHCNNNKLFPLLSGKSVDLILTDPPYNISKESNFSKGKGKFSKHTNNYGEWDNEVLNWNYIASEFKRVLKPGGKVIIFYDVWKMGDIKSIFEKFGFEQSRLCEWIKTNPMPINSKHNYLSNAKEYFIVFTKPGWVNRKRAKSTFNSEYNKGVYEYPTVSGRESTGVKVQKPLKLFRQLIKEHSNKSDTILDPFIGTGTTGEASVLEGRNYIGCDKLDIHIEKCKKRNLYVESL